MKISDKDIKYLADLVKLDFEEADKEKMIKSIAEITELFDVIKELEITENTSEGEFLELREDIEENGLNEAGLVFAVPRIVG